MNETTAPETGTAPAGRDSSELFNGAIPLDHAGRPKVTNEMKAECIGEFHFTRETTCSACDFDKPDPECEVCGGEVEYTETITVPWDTCKAIYKAMAKAAMQSR